jgi:hypothetical protein
MGESQMAWLKGVLDRAKAAHEHVVLFSHFPVFPKANYHNLWNADEVLGMLDGYRGTVVAYVNGHDHRGGYGRYPAGTGIHYLTLEGMVETEKQGAYGVLKIYDDRLVFTGSERATDKVVMPY